MKIKVKVFSSDGVIPKMIEKGDWIDLVAAEDVTLHGPSAGVLKRDATLGTGVRAREVSFDMQYIPLGVAMHLPEGYEAVVLPRSSTPVRLGIMCANSQGVIDNSYCGDSDQWCFPALALRSTVIYKGTRICQFRIQLSQKATAWQKIKWLFSSKIEFEVVESLGNPDRNGLGSTGN